MKNSKKFLSAVLAFAMILTLTACSGDANIGSLLDSFTSDKSSTGEATESSSTTSEVPKPQIDPDTIAESPAEDFEYEYNYRFDGIEIKRYIGNRSVVKIPAKIDGGRVVAIGGYAFSGCGELTSVIIPDGVTVIGFYAFLDCYGITSITIPNGVTTIGGCAFAGCTELTSVTIPNSVTTIGNRAFSYCEGLTSVTIPNSVTIIGYSAFSGCTGLTSVTIPNSVTEIGSEAFMHCEGLTTINVDSNNQNYTSKDGVLYNKDMTTLIQCPAKKQGAFSIPNSVTTIGDSAFSGCTGLTSVTIPNSVTRIGMSAFSLCEGLTSITIPDSVTEICAWAFDGCTAEITYKGETYTSDDDYDALYKAING